MSLPSATDVEDAIRRVIVDIMPDLPAAEITRDKSLRDLGADSVDRVEIISLLLHRLQRSDPISVFATIPDIGALVEYLSSNGEKSD
ncbi:phosphopantetheine-binding protein [Amycolatopsis palatopharyngis]|uniref:phosphopantetheine-binding protein n=1 Tax=Amycolatopsis palatopharyngis TaxID=187982 RepID=UPI000E239B04|nr:phosphopantetheine-binding protein [Amycolatopsis palatopharyngis]